MMLYNVYDLDLEFLQTSKAKSKYFTNNKFDFYNSSLYASKNLTIRFLSNSYHNSICQFPNEPSINDVTHLGEGGSSKRWRYSISIFGKMGDNWGGRGQKSQKIGRQHL